jgi:hypothetical protein
MKRLKLIFDILTMPDEEIDSVCYQVTQITWKRIQGKHIEWLKRINKK